MTEKTKSSKERALDRMTDGGIFMIGDEVIHDGEAEKYGDRKKTAPKKAMWPDADDDE